MHDRQHKPAPKFPKIIEHFTKTVWIFSKHTAHSDPRGKEEKNRNEWRTDQPIALPKFPTGERDGRCTCESRCFRKSSHGDGPFGKEPRSILFVDPGDASVAREKSLVGRDWHFGGVGGGTSGRDAAGHCLVPLYRWILFSPPRAYQRPVVKGGRSHVAWKVAGSIAV